MELKLTRSILKLDIYGEIVELKKPTFGEVESLEKMIKESSGDSEKTKEVLKSFLTSCGLQPELMQKMELEHVFQVVELLSGKKKA